MSVGNACLAEPNLEVKDWFSFFLLRILNDVKSGDTMRSFIVVLLDDNK